MNTYTIKKVTETICDFMVELPSPSEIPSYYHDYFLGLLKKHIGCLVKDLSHNTVEIKMLKMTENKCYSLAFFCEDPDMFLTWMYDWHYHKVHIYVKKYKFVTQLKEEKA